jgi:hypothetical protein
MSHGPTPQPPIENLIRFNTTISAIDIKNLRYPSARISLWNFKMKINVQGLKPWCLRSDITGIMMQKITTVLVLLLGGVDQC